MKLTCLSQGDGFHFPPCHMLNVCGFRILIDCPLDLSSISIFSPVPNDFGSVPDDEITDTPAAKPESAIRKKRKIEKSLTASSLVHAEPWYKTVKSLHLWDASFIDIVLISSPMGMLGLPYLTQNPTFSAKVYATEATARIGKLMMEDLESMHMEFRRFYGADDSRFPQWIKQLELEEAPRELKKIAFGLNEDDVGCWMPLYSVDDAKHCMKKVHTLRFAEEVCYNGTLIVKALSSGLDIGTCNWSINGPKSSISYISGSIFASYQSMGFDFHGLRGNDVILFSDFSSLGGMEETENGGNDNELERNSISALSVDDKHEELDSVLLEDNEKLEEMEKLAFICSCAVDSVKSGGSTLITISRIGIVLELLEQMMASLDSSSVKVPIYVISSVVEELLAYANTIPEWLCKQRQERFLSGEPLFAHVDLVKDKKIQIFPALYSPNLITNWQEPCIVFAPHWSLRLGPSVQILRCWCGDPRSLLVLENGIDANLALLPYKPMEMKVLQCSFLSGIRLQKVQPLLKTLQPRLVLLADVMRQQISSSGTESYSILHFSENLTLRVPRVLDTSEVEITAELASYFTWRKLKESNFDVARLEGELLMHQGKHQFLPGFKPKVSKQARPLQHWGSFAPERLLNELMKMGISGSIEQNAADSNLERVGVVRINGPKVARIEIAETGTVVSADDENLASSVLKAVDSILDGV